MDGWESWVPGGRGCHRVSNASAEASVGLTLSLLSCTQVKAGPDGGVTVTWTTGQPFVSKLIVSDFVRCV